MHMCKYACFPTFTGVSWVGDIVLWVEIKKIINSEN